MQKASFRVCQSLKTVCGKHAYAKNLSAILMPDRHAVGRLEVTDFLEA